MILGVLKEVAEASIKAAGEDPTPEQASWMIDVTGAALEAMYLLRLEREIRELPFARSRLADLLEHIDNVRAFRAGKGASS